MKKIMLVSLICLILACSVTENIKQAHNILVIMAHPDDETWLSGTLAKLVDLGQVIVPVYLTSGDKGTDRSGQGLKGGGLAKVRELEAINAAKVLGLSSPLFLRFPDGKLKSHTSKISEQLELIKAQYDPVLTFTFEPLGITGNKDHQAVSKITSDVFKQNVIYFSISNTRATRFIDFASSHDLAFEIKHPINDDGISHFIDVTDYSEKRVKAMRQHKTQFPSKLVAVFSEFSKQQSIEEFIIKDIETKKLFENYIKN